MSTPQTEDSRLVGELFAIDASTDELALLAGISGARTVFGLQNPYRAWMPDEIAAAMTQAESRLIRQGYLSANADGTYELNGDVAILAHTMAHPACTFLATISQRGYAPEDKSLFLGDDVVAGLVPIGDDRYRLGVFEDRATAISLLGQWLGLDGQKPAGGRSISVPHHAAKQALAQSGDDSDAATTLLTAAGVPEEDARLFVETIGSAARLCSLRALRAGRLAWEVDGFGTIESPDGLWRQRLIERDGDQWVELQPASADALARDVERIVARIAGSPARRTDAGGVTSPGGV